jgi:hypothetical protein
VGLKKAITLHEAIDNARHDVAISGGRIKVCAGPPRCDREEGNCEFCYVIVADDPRTTGQIIAEMDKRNQWQ